MAHEAMKANGSKDVPLLIVGLGEALFDCFPDRAVLGGAPVNFAVHAHALLNRVGGSGAVATRVGNDELGKRYLNELDDRQVDRTHVQIDLEQPTGTVEVSIDSAGHASYTFASNVAWDYLEFTEDWKQLAPECDLVSFGTLAQRSPQSRDAISQFLASASNAVRLFDVNFRQQFYSPEILENSLELASAMKLNAEELGRVCRMLDLADPAVHSVNDQAVAIIEKHQLDWLALTRGAEGTALYANGNRFEGEPANFPPEDRADSVGAGDACCAGLAVGRLLEWPGEKTLALANQMGAFVASRRGATPEIPSSLLDRVQPG
jgi:fructokinase